MQLNSIHEEANHRDQHWAGDYFGPGGALDSARKKYEEKMAAASSAFDATWAERQSDLLRVTMQLMSTVYSAIGHCASQVAARRINNKLWYMWQALLLLFKLDELVSQVVMNEDRKKSLAPGERDVLIASLLLLPGPILWFLFSYLYRKEAVELLRHQINNPFRSEVSLLFAMARAYRVKGSHFTEGEREFFYDTVHVAIYLYAPDGDGEPKLNWSDVARLARMIHHKDRQRQAAEQDGSEDARLKAGVSI